MALKKGQTNCGGLLSKLSLKNNKRSLTRVPSSAHPSFTTVAHLFVSGLQCCLRAGSSPGPSISALAGAGRGSLRRGPAVKVHAGKDVLQIRTGAVQLRWRLVERVRFGIALVEAVHRVPGLEARVDAREAAPHVGLPDRALAAALQAGVVGVQAAELALQ